MQDPRKITQNKGADWTQTRKAFTGPERVPEVLGDKFVASTHTNVVPLPQTLPVIGEEEEDTWEGVMSGVRGGLGPQDPDASWCSHSGPEATPSLYIHEEEEQRKPACLQHAVATLTGPRAPKEDSSDAQTSKEVP